MDDKLQALSVRDSCLALAQNPCDADANCVWLTADTYTTDYLTGGKLYEAGQCAVDPGVAYTELDKDSAVPSGMLAYWYLEYHWSALLTAHASRQSPWDGGIR